MKMNNGKRKSARLLFYILAALFAAEIYLFITLWNPS